KHRTRKSMPAHDSAAWSTCTAWVPRRCGAAKPRSKKFYAPLGPDDTMTRDDLSRMIAPWAAQLAALRKRFATWWLKEFWSLFPESFIERWLVGGRKRVILAAGTDSVLLELSGRADRSLASQSVALSEFSSAAIDRFAQQNRLDPSEVEVGLRLRADEIFCRKIILPSEAAGSVAQIVQQDLARKTPFKPLDIHHDHVIVPIEGERKLAVWQWITRRIFVEQAASTLRIDVDKLAFVEGGNGAGREGPIPTIALQANVRSQASWSKRLMLALSCSALILTVLAGGLKYWRQQIAIEDLDVRIATAKVKAQQVRTTIEGLKQSNAVLTRIRSQKSEPGLVDILDEATRVLPAHSWLTEFRVSEVSGGRELQVVM